MHKFGNIAICGAHVTLTHEIQVISVDLVAQIEQLRLQGVRRLAFGDFKRLPPVCNCWRGRLVAPRVFEKSRQFHQWCQGTKFVLRGHCRPDQAHLETYTRLRDLPRQECLEEARRIYPPPNGSATGTSACPTTTAAGSINHACQSRLAAEIDESDKIRVDG